jgi:hypothetical protein
MPIPLSPTLGSRASSASGMSAGLEFNLRGGTRHRDGSYGDAPARAAFCVAPGYR